MLTVLPCLTGAVVNKIMQARVSPPRDPIVKRPSDYGMQYESVDILSSDGVRLSAWLMNKNSDKLVIVNHPLNCSRYGSTKGMDGVAVEFLPMVKALYDAGYGIITYDQRGQGESDGGVGKTMKGKEVIVGVGATEWQDLIGVLEYVKQHASLSKAKVGLLVQCMGANACFKACMESPASMEPVKCIVALQPTISKKMMARVTKLKTGKDLSERIEEVSTSRYNMPLANGSEFVRAVKAPILFVQVKADVYVGDAQGHDVQAIFDNCTAPKEILWIGPGTEHPFGSGKRFECYNYFNHHPEAMLKHFNSHLNA